MMDGPVLPFLGSAKRRGHPQETPGKVWRYFGGTMWWTGSATWLEARDAAKSPIVHRTNPSANNYPKCQWCQG